MSKSITTIKHVSAKLGLYPRALQRLLVQDGTTHANDLDDVPQPGLPRPVRLGP
ncbi:hypothetical protein WG901_22950 [Novosphingobium sp. PS1R-30]|uniref:Uncharacterized protein n=1 Tax=Novosphingobium anseongense TaxID=3133436 RepID=A0ABU8S2E8_9SPHN